MIKVKGKEYETLSQAVSEAGKLKIGRGVSVAVVLPGGTSHVINSGITINRNLHFKGPEKTTKPPKKKVEGAKVEDEKAEDEKVADVPTIIFEGAGRFNMVDKAAVKFTNIDFHLPPGPECSALSMLGNSMLFDKCHITVLGGEYPQLLTLTQGQVDIKNSNLVGLRLMYEEEAAGTLENVEMKTNGKLDEHYALIYNSRKNCVIRNLSLESFINGIHILGRGSYQMFTSRIRCVKQCALVESRLIATRDCSFSAPEGCAITAKSFGLVRLRDSTIGESVVGMHLEESSGAEVSRCKMVGISSVWLRGETSGTITVSGGQWEETKDNVDAIWLTNSSVLKASKIVLSGFNRAVTLEGIGVSANLNGVELKGCHENCIRVLDGAIVNASRMKFNNSGGPCVVVDDEASQAYINDSTFTGGFGVLVSKGGKGGLRTCVFKNMKRDCVEVSGGSIDMVSCTVTDSGGNGVLVGEKAVVNLSFTKISGSAEAGVRMIDDSSKLNLRLVNLTDNESAFAYEGGEASLDGCTFTNSRTYAIDFTNPDCEHKDYNPPLSLRWCSYMESKLEGETSNQLRVESKCTKEKSFFGGYEYEYRIFANVLVERIRAAYEYNSSPEKTDMAFAETCMCTVSAVCAAVPEIKQQLLQTISDSPVQALFCGTFSTPNCKALFQLDEVVGSWKTLKRIETFDEALKALDESYKARLVAAGVYYSHHLQVADFRREAFPTVKYHRRRDYLIAAAHSDPLRAWYMLAQETNSTLRHEVLTIMVSGENAQMPNPLAKAWVSSWAMQEVNDGFLSKVPTKGTSPEYRFNWCNAMLDRGRVKEVIAVYKANSINSDNDTLLLFEAYERLGGPQAAAEVRKVFKGRRKEEILSKLPTAFRVKEYGTGVLPGYVRRFLKTANDPTEVLQFLAQINKNAQHRDMFNVATMAYFLNPEAEKGPAIDNSKPTEVCSICFTEELVPWKSIQFSHCNFDHRFCFKCAMQSASSGELRLWGVCPGEGTKNEPCEALATRGEMEISGMSKAEIYKVLKATVSSRLQRVPGWKDCCAPNCVFGGMSLVNGKCALCVSLDDIIKDSLNVAEDAPPSVRVIQMRLLKGLDANFAKNGSGIFRECYYCARTYEKGDACMSVTCTVCQKSFDMTFALGPVTASYGGNGVGKQHYVPKVKGVLWDLGVFKDVKGLPLKLGSFLTDDEADEVARRALEKFNEYLK